jgi:hypothetical protein
VIKLNVNLERDVGEREQRDEDGEMRDKQQRTSNDVHSFYQPEIKRSVS